MITRGSRHYTLQTLIQNCTLTCHRRRLAFSIPIFRKAFSAKCNSLQDIDVSASRTSGGQLRQGPNELPIAPQADTVTSPLSLPETCTGCGAFTQSTDSGLAGFFSPYRKVVQKWLKDARKRAQEGPESNPDDVVRKAFEKSSPDQLKRIGLPEEIEIATRDETPLPLCDRCHALVHHQSAIPIDNPSLDSISNIVANSPFSTNKVYHVIDAADFPLSLVPRFQSILSLMPQRARNRRAKHLSRRMGPEITFIITRSDLLAPQKEQVDRLMPYFVDILRDALGRKAERARLGNVRCVSAKRGWWTKELKQDIWSRGGGHWMVGKVNVGKSNLFEVVFPKGTREQYPDLSHDKSPSASLANENHRLHDRISGAQAGSGDDNDLLPPARPETPFPMMPTISSMPGTTAAPIRIPFGRGRGELIDLPGLERSQLLSYIQPGFRGKMIMESRIKPRQKTLKPGQSLLLGGLIRIDNQNEDMVVLAYPFSELEPHVTSIEKANMVGRGERERPVSFVTEENVFAGLKSAGRFGLEWDVTKGRAGPLTARSAVGLKVERLPFKVLSTDILIDGLGWVELVAQVRRLSFPSEGQDDFPKVDVFSPEGRFIGTRKTLGASQFGLNSKPKRRSAH